MATHMDLDTAHDYIDKMISLYGQELDRDYDYADYLKGIISAFDDPGSPDDHIEKAFYSAVIMGSDGALDYHRYKNDPSYDPGKVINSWSGYTGAEFLDYFYPDAVHYDELAQALDEGEIQAGELLMTMGANGFSRDSISVSDVQASSAENFLRDDALGGVGGGAPSVPEDDAPSNDGLPDAGLTFPGLDDAQLDFLIAMYVGSFGRAPEHDGLKYWAGEAARMLEEGQDFGTVSQAIGASFYEAGKANGESGTGLDTTGFVTQAYDNALGREPDEEGLAYWVQELDAGNLSRGQFMAYFVNAALANGGDGDHIVNSVAVAEFIAQEHVSGQDELDMALLELVNDVAGEQSAIDLIGTITEEYPATDVVGVSQADVSYDIA